MRRKEWQRTLCGELKPPKQYYSDTTLYRDHIQAYSTSQLSDKPHRDGSAALILVREHVIKSRVRVALMCLRVCDSKASPCVPRNLTTHQIQDLLPQLPKLHISSSFIRRICATSTIASTLPNKHMPRTVASSSSSTPSLAEIPFVRRRLLPEQVSALQSLYEVKSHPSKEERAALAAELGM